MVDTKGFVNLMGQELQPSDVDEIKFLLKHSCLGKSHNQIFSNFLSEAAVVPVIDISHRKGSMD